MKKWIIVFALLVGSSIVFAQRNQPSQMNGIGISSHPIYSNAATSGLMSLWGNPAGISAYNGAGFLFMAPMDSTEYLKDYALGLRLGGLAFSAEWINDVPVNAQKPRVYHIALSSEISDGLYFGARYRFSEKLPQQNEWSIGLLGRPYSWLSIGGTIRNINQANVLNHKTYTSFDGGLALRPFAFTSWKHGHRVTLGTDVSIYEENPVFVPSTRNPVKYGDKIDPRIFLEVEPINGVKVQTQYATDYEELRLGISLTTDRSALTHTTRIKDGESVGGVSSSLYESDGLLSLPFPPKKLLVKMKIPTNLNEEKEPFSFFSQPTPLLEKFLKKLRRLTKDSNVKGLVLEIEEVNYPMSTMQAVNRELRKFKAEGKKIYVYSKSMGNRAYALATIADKIYLHPEGDLFLTGFATSGLYLKRTLDKLGLEMEVEASGPHKTAPNMFTEDHMTAQDRAQREWLVGDLYRQFVEMIAINKGWSIEKTKSIIDNGPYLAEDAMSGGLIDSVFYADEFEKKIKEVHSGKKSNDDGKKVKFLFVDISTQEDKVSITSASQYFSEPDIDPRWDRPLEPKIAVIYAVGAINSGKSSPGGLFSDKTMGSETMVKLIRSARKNKQVKAIVLRVDSPGGSGFASDEMWRELMLCKTDDKTKKPIIISMASVAASGGYYIAIPGDKIVAEEGTITGSIGVFSMRPVVDSTLKKIGTKYEEIKFGKRAGMFNVMRRHNPDERKVVEDIVKNFYRKFVQKVADGRSMKWESVDSIGNGRVWTGMQGLKNGLVDTLGGLDVAIELAKQAANFPESAKPDIIVYSRATGWDPLLEMQVAMYHTIPEPVRNAIKNVQSVSETQNQGILLVAPKWIKDEILYDEETSVAR